MKMFLNLQAYNLQDLLKKRILDVLQRQIRPNFLGDFLI